MMIRLVSTVMRVSGKRWHNIINAKYDLDANANRLSMINYPFTFTLQTYHLIGHLFHYSSKELHDFVLPL